jgi:hypothetical protein
MDIEQKIKTKLLIRGFSKETLLNNRGLIGATTDETILEVVKNLGIANVSQQRELLSQYNGYLNIQYQSSGYDDIDISDFFEWLN